MVGPQEKEIGFMSKRRVLVVLAMLTARRRRWQPTKWSSRMATSLTGTVVKIEGGKLTFQLQGRRHR